MPPSPTSVADALAGLSAPLDLTCALRETMASPKNAAAAAASAARDGGTPVNAFKTIKGQSSPGCRPSPADDWANLPHRPFSCFDLGIASAAPRGKKLRRRRTAARRRHGVVGPRPRGARRDGASSDTRGVDSTVSRPQVADAGRARRAARGPRRPLRRHGLRLRL